MIFKRGEHKKPLPAYSRIENVYLERGQISYVLERVEGRTFDEIISKAGEEALGMPAYFCLMGRDIWLWPACDKTTKIVVRYAPPLKEV